jgi:hypothetical protein
MFQIKLEHTLVRSCSIRLQPYARAYFLSDGGSKPLLKNLIVENIKKNCSVVLLLKSYCLFLSLITAYTWF